MRRHYLGLAPAESTMVLNYAGIGPARGISLLGRLLNG
jgi:hypothetical protein